MKEVLAIVLIQICQEKEGLNLTHLTICRTKSSLILRMPSQMFWCMTQASNHRTTKRTKTKSRITLEDNPAEIPNDTFKQQRMVTNLSKRMTLPCTQTLPEVFTTCPVTYPHFKTLPQWLNKVPNVTKRLQTSISKVSSQSKHHQTITTKPP